MLTPLAAEPLIMSSETELWHYRPNGQAKRVLFYRWVNIPSGGPPLLLRRFGAVSFET